VGLSSRAKRGLAVLVVGGGMLLGAWGQTASADILDYGCSPPLPADSANCPGWHTTPVTLRWKWDQFLYDVLSGNCSVQTFSTDISTQVACKVGDASTSVEKTVAVKVDVTAPTVTGATPDRPPDYNGWWNHPVTFTFAGTDATSGISACDAPVYSGPDGAAAAVTGGCRDVAGNASTLTVPLKYDATPPSVTGATATPADAGAKVSWSPSADVVRSEVARTPGETAAPSTRVFDGTTSSFTDVGLVNGTSYSYKITVFDDAGNSAAATTTVVPAPPPRAGPSASTRATSPPMLRWRPIGGARYYNVQVFRGRYKILSAWPVKARMRMGKSWRFRGKRYQLTRARYRWYVWPGYGPRAARRYGALIRKGTFYYRP
jgi:hypothetical protein